MAARAALPGLLLLLLIAGLRAQDDFDLSDALPDGRDTQPTAAPRKPSPGDSGPPKPKPKPDSGTSGGFSDADLSDVSERRPGAPGGAGGGDDEAAAAQPPGLVPGIVGAVAVAAVGAVSSFIAYQRRRLCFREGESSTA